MPIRPLDQQFGTTTVCRIRQIQARLRRSQLIAPGMEQMRQETIGCLDAGLLLAGLLSIAPLLESAVRELLIRHAANIDSLGDEDFQKLLEADLEEFYEENKTPRFGFPEMIKKLVEMRVMKSRQARDFQGFYCDIRIPLHHGLVRRFSSKMDDFGIESLFGRLGRRHRIEDTIENRGLELLERGVDLLDLLGTISGGQQGVTPHDGLAMPLDNSETLGGSRHR